MDGLIVKDRDFWIAFLNSFGAVAFFIGNLFYLVLYLGKWPCIEKFKGSDEPWPWETELLLE